MSSINVSVFNGDAGIQVACPNIDGALRSGPDGAVTGPLAAKCMQVAPRAMHLPGNSGAVALYQRPSEEYLDYVRGLYGGCPQIIAPEQIDMTNGLKLSRELLCCDRSLHDLRGLGMAGAVLDPFISEPRMFDLARQTGMSVRGISEAHVRAGLVSELNDKQLFQEACRKIGIPIPPSTVVLGWDNVMAQATRIFDRDGKVVLRRARAAGGLGVLMIEASDVSGTLADHLRAKVYPFEAWDSEPVLVEEMLDIVASPSTLVYADAARFDIRAMSEQIVSGGSFYGSIYPMRQPEHLARQMTEWTAKYAAHFISVGGAGWFNIDWGITATGEIVAFESNARYTGSVHPKVIAQRLRRDRQIGHVWSNDACAVPVGTKFDRVREALRDLAWSEYRQAGVVITIPPAGNAEKFALGYVVLADSRYELDELHGELSCRIASL
jgi:hypothetical protein